MDGILVETDAPWLAPAPDRGKRNEPAWVTRTAHTLAGLLAVPTKKLLPRLRKTSSGCFARAGRGKLIQGIGIACGGLSRFEKKDMAQENSFDIVSKVDMQESATQLTRR